MRASHVLFALLSLASASGDVMPSCGKREPHVAKPGDACGGPFVCAPPSTCGVLDRTLRTASFSTVYVCTKACAMNADCADLGVPMSCGATGKLRGYGQPSERVCIPVGAVVEP